MKWKVSEKFTISYFWAFRNFQFEYLCYDKRLAYSYKKDYWTTSGNIFITPKPHTQRRLQLRIIWEAGVGMEMTSTVRDNCKTAREGNDKDVELSRIKM